MKMFLQVHRTELSVNYCCKLGSFLLFLKEQQIRPQFVLRPERQVCPFCSMDS